MECFKITTANENKFNKRVQQNGNMFVKQDTVSLANFRVGLHGECQQNMVDCFAEIQNSV